MPAGDGMSYGVPLGTFKMLWAYESGRIVVPVDAIVTVTRGEKDGHVTCVHKACKFHLKESVVPRYLDLSARYVEHHTPRPESAGAQGLAVLRGWDRPRIFSAGMSALLRTKVEAVLAETLEWPDSVDELLDPSARECWSFVSGVACVFGVTAAYVARLAQEGES